MCDEGTTCADHHLDEERRHADEQLQDHRQVRIYLLILCFIPALTLQILATALIILLNQRTHRTLAGIFLYFDLFAKRVFISA